MAPQHHQSLNLAVTGVESLGRHALILALLRPHPGENLAARLSSSRSAGRMSGCGYSQSALGEPPVGLLAVGAIESFRRARRRGPGADAARPAAIDYRPLAMSGLLAELGHLRNANRLAASRLSEDNLAAEGIASNHPVTARASLYMLVGHVAYHLRIMRSRLGLPADA